MLADGHKPRLHRTSGPPERDRNAEARVQRAILEYIWAVAPQVSYRDPREAARLEWLGATLGVPDLVLLLPAGRVALIEVKPPGGRLSDEQIEFRDHLIRMGVPICVAMSVDDVRLAFGQWGVSTGEAAQ
jgi:hypothetical protein